MEDLESPQFEERAAALRQLAAENRPLTGVVSRVLGVALLDEHPLPRAEAIAALESVADGEVAQALIPFLESGSRLVRRRALRLLTRLHPWGAQVLANLLASHPHPRIRRQAADTLGRMGAEDTCSDLGEALEKDGDASVRAKAAASLGRLGNRQWVASLAKATRDTYPDVRLAAIKALGDLGGSGAALALLKPEDPKFWTEPQGARMAAQSLSRCLLMGLGIGENGSEQSEEEENFQGAEEAKARESEPSSPKHPTPCRECVAALDQLTGEGMASAIRCTSLMVHFKENADCSEESAASPLQGVEGNCLADLDLECSNSSVDAVLAQAGAPKPSIADHLPLPKEWEHLANASNATLRCAAARLLGQQMPHPQAVSGLGRLIGDRDSTVAWVAQMALTRNLSSKSLLHRCGLRPTHDRLSAKPPFGLKGNLPPQNKPKAPFPLAVAAMTFSFAKNVGTLIRSAEACNAKEVFVVGSSGFHLGGAKGSHNWIDVHHVPDLDTLVSRSRKAGYALVAVQQCPGAVHFREVRYPPKALFLLGAEGPGLSQQALLAVDLVVEIPVYGAIDSLNVAVAGTVVLQEWLRQQDS